MEKIYENPRVRAARVPCIGFLPVKSTVAVPNLEPDLYYLLKFSTCIISGIVLNLVPVVLKYLFFFWCSSPMRVHTTIIYGHRRVE